MLFNYSALQPYKVYSKPENEISGAIIDYNDDELKRLAELIQSTQNELKIMNFGSE